jgi:hypothetical protein
MPDGWEVAHQLNPRQPDHNADPDEDGFPNSLEFRAGTDPRSAASALTLQTTRTDTGVWLRWDAVPGKTYSLRMRERLDEQFNTLEGFPRIAQAPNGSYWIDLDAPANRERYYQLMVE